MDISSSMNQTNADGITKIVAAKKAATNFVGHLRLPDQGGVTSFWGSTTNNQRLTTNYAGVITVISNLALVSGTRIDYGITNAHAELQSTNHNKAALPLMVVLTDGQNDGGTSSNVVIAAAAAKAADIRIIAVAFGTNADTTLLKYSVASSTNDYYYATNSSQLDGVYDLIAASICRATTNTPPTIAWVTPTNNQLFVSSPTNILLWATSTAGSITKMLFYNGTNYLGETNAEPYQYLWTNVSSGTHTNLKAIGTNSTTGVSVTNIISITVNAMPFITNNAPTNLQPFTEWVNVGLTNTAWDTDGKVTNVTFYTWTNSVPAMIGVGISNNLKYSYTWNNRTNGFYSYYAVATDNRGAQSTSPITVFKVNGTNPLPQITITGPTNGAVFKAGTDFAISAMATNTNGTAISSVDFFRDNTRMAGDSAAPYEASVTGLLPGTYQFLARATNVNGMEAVSQPVTVTIQDWETVSANGYWDPAFQLADWDNPLRYGFPLTIAVNSSNEVYVGAISQSLHPRFYRWQSCAWNPPSGLDGTRADAVSYHKGQLFMANGTAALCWDEASTNLIDLTFNLGVLGYPRSLFVYKGELVAGGNFHTNGLDYGAVKLVNSTWTPVGNEIEPGTFGYGAVAIAAIGDDLYIGGDFTAVGGDTNVAYVAKLVGTNWVALGSGVNGTVRALAVWNGQLLVGGAFTQAGGNTNIVGLAKWDGTSWSPIGGALGLDVSDYYHDSPIVNAIAVHGNSVFVGGVFGTLQNGDDMLQALGVGLLRWSSDAQNWTWSAMDRGVSQIDYWGASSPGEVTTIALRERSTTNGYDVLVGGDFELAGDVGSLAVARWVMTANDCTNGYPPSVYWYFPTSGSLDSFTNLTALDLSVNATTGYQSQIESVDFYANGNHIGIGTNDGSWGSTNGYRFTWDPTSGLTNGIFRLDAIARDTNGLANKATVIVAINAPNTITAQRDSYDLFVNAPATNLNVLANDSASPPNSLRILSAGNADRIAVPPLPHGGLLPPPAGAVAGSVQVSHDQKSLIYTPYRNSAGTDLLTYSVTDGVSTNSALVTIKIHAPPGIEIQTPTGDAKFRTNTNITISGDSFDYDGAVTNVTLFVNGTNKVGQTVNPQFSFTWNTNTPGFYTFIAVATDNEGFTNSSSPVTLTLTNSSVSPHLPVAAITSPAPSVTYLGSLAVPNALIVRDGQITNLVGSAYDLDAGDVVGYQLLLLDPQNQFGPPLYNVTPGALNSQGFHAGAVTNASLGNIDLSMVDNGTYVLTLVVRGAGDLATTNLLIAVDSNLKIGQFSFSEQDMVIPVNGIPLTVTRTYNSLNPRLGDFGYSWSYALNSLDVQLDEIREQHFVGSDRLPISYDEDTDENGLPLDLAIRVAGSRDVTLTLPDGRRTTFQFYYDGPHSCNGDSYGKYCYEAKWQAAPGINYELTAVGNPVYNGLSGYWNNEQGTGFESYDFSGFILKAPDGTVFNITRGNANDVLFDNTGDGHYVNVAVYGPPKLTSIVQRSGDYIKITDAGITHYNASNQITRAVFIERGDEGRIVAIRDPNSGSNGLPVVKYIYNRETGNLIQVHRLQDRTVGNYLVTKYHYDHAKFPHFITSIEDPRGIPLARNEYDDSGRLTAVVDADGKRTAFFHNTTNRVEIVTDRLGNTNSFGYDLKGNVTAMTNALSQVVTNGYDDFNNKTNDVVFFNGQPYATNRYQFDTNLLRVSINALGYSNTFAYGQHGRLEISTDAKGISSTNYYNDTTDNLIAVADALGNTTSNYFSSTSLLLGTRDAIGTLTTNRYDALGNLTGSATLSGSTILSTNTFGYDANGNQTNSVTWRRVSGNWVGATNTTIYDAQNRVVQTIAPDGGVNTTVYNSLGKQDYTVDAAGRTNRFAYDAQGRLYQTTYPDGSFEVSYFDVEGRTTNSVDRAGRGTTNYFDALGRVSHTVYADNTTNRTVYDGLGRVQFSVDARGVTNAFAYDVLGRRVAVTNAWGTSMAVTNRFGYDANGNQPYVTNALGVVTTNYFDSLNRVTNVLFADGTKMFTGYDAVGRRVAETNQDNIVTRFGYDDAGKLIAATNAFGTSGQQAATRYEYDEAGNQIAQIDALNRTNRFEYDNIGRRTKRTLPGNQSETFGYDVLGNLMAQTNFNGTIITNQYDVMSRLWKRWTSGVELEAYLYSVMGRLTNRTDASGTHTWVYDLRDRPRTNTTPVGSLYYTYDANGNQLSLSSATANGVNIAYEYDALNRLTNAVDNRLTGTKNTGYTFDRIGNLATLKYPNGVTNLWQYDSLNRLTNLTWKLNGAARGDFAYKLGAAGHRTNLTETVNAISRVFTWQYDKLYRLTNETVTGTAPTGTLGYGYDPVGNRTNRTGTLGALGSQTLAYSTNDWVDNDANPGNGSTYFDANGNTTSLDGTWQYDWANRLTNFNSGTATYVYDATGNRIKKTAGGVTTWYLVAAVNPSGWPQVVEEHTGSSPGTVSRRYTYGLDLISQSRWTGSVWDTHFYLTDGLGSTRALLNSSGNISDTYVYDAYGTLLTSSGTTPNDYRFAGEQWDANISQYYLRSRTFNPSYGRFWTMDTHAGNNQDPLSLHKYLYGADDPVNNIDPSGESSVSEQLSVSGITGIVQGATRLLNTVDKVARAKQFVDTLMIIQHQLTAYYTGDIGGAALQSHLKGKAQEAVQNVTRKFFQPKLLQRYARLAKLYQKARKLALDKFLQIPSDQVYQGSKGIPVVYIGGSTENERPLTGDRHDDFKLANQLAGFGNGATSEPRGYTWHHHEMMGVMVLVKTKWHKQNQHHGGAAVYRWYYGEGYE